MTVIMAPLMSSAIAFSGARYKPVSTSKQASFYRGRYSPPTYHKSILAHFSHSVSECCIGRTILFCMQRYNCNVDKVCSGLMTDVIKSLCATSTDHHAATANLLHEIIMVRDNFLTLPGWFTHDDINDIIFSICVS